MKLTWLGHACFLLEQNGYRLIVDPYTGVEGYPELRVKAHQVVCSHQHHDHNAVEQITPLPAQENPFTIRVVKTFHDDQGGALRREHHSCHQRRGHHSGAPGRLGASTNGGAARRHRHGGWSPGAGRRCVHGRRCRGQTGLQRDQPPVGGADALPPRALRLA